MKRIPLIAAPNQRLTVTIDRVRYGLALKMARGVLTCSVSVNGADILTGGRVLAGELIIPYRYLETGNFLLRTPDGELPDWRQLGTTHRLYFLTAVELGAIRG